ncbi:MAG: hypothetical protein P8176_09520 [Gammaproteobacteria bacterium]
MSLFCILQNVFGHCLQNTMDHGIESSACRKQAGKPEAGGIEFVVKRDMETKRVYIIFIDVVAV